MSEKLGIEIPVRPLIIVRKGAIPFFILSRILENNPERNDSAAHNGKFSSLPRRDLINLDIVSFKPFIKFCNRQ